MFQLIKSKENVQCELPISNCPRPRVGTFLSFALLTWASISTVPKEDRVRVAATEREKENAATSDLQA